MSYRKNWFRTFFHYWFLLNNHFSTRIYCYEWWNILFQVEINEGKYTVFYHFAMLLVFPFTIQHCEIWQYRHSFLTSRHWDSTYNWWGHFHYLKFFASFQKFIPYTYVRVRYQLYNNSLVIIIYLYLHFKNISTLFYLLVRIQFHGKIMVWSF